MLNHVDDVFSSFFFLPICSPSGWLVSLCLLNFLCFHREWPPPPKSTNLDVPHIICLGLVGLQHRGQESAGIVTSYGREMEFVQKKGMGLVNTIFTEQDMLRMRGNLGIGELLARTRVLTATKDESQDVVATVCPPRSDGASPTKSGPLTSGTCFRCSVKGHIAKDCQKHRTRCY
ncbi:purF [Acanthosepion pharaonis]|uniref:PurF n=1 Tax=Acanthosepion pharaonis TaxID=158019 RepID=A0A812CGY6_ACAPH|nr:purF [Sepia pharaonis]